MSLPPNYSLLAKHPNRFYVETGIYRNDSIAQAIEAGFENIIGIELFQEWIDFGRSRFPPNEYPHVKYIHGDSALVLWDVIKHINVPVTYLLDAHSQWLEDEPEIETPFPLFKELEQIARHPIKNSTILIDDILILTHSDVTGWDLADIFYAIQTINDNYHFDLIANPVKGNFLVATVK